MYHKITNISSKTLSEKNNMPCQGLIYEVNGHFIKPGKSLTIVLSSLPEYVQNNLKDDEINSIIEVTEIKENEDNAIKKTTDEQTSQAEEEKLRKKK